MDIQETLRLNPDQKQEGMKCQFLADSFEKVMERNEGWEKFLSFHWHIPEQ